MNINKINEAIKQVSFFLLANLTGILLLSGLGVIVYAFFKISIIIGLFAWGACLILISLVLAKEGR